MSDPTQLDILMITYNRPEYTKRSLEQLLSTCDETMRVWIWHNGDHKETLDAVKSFQAHPNFHRLEISKENRRLRGPTNWFWKSSTAPYLSKVDDDCLLPKGWAQTMISAHEANPNFGSIGCWRFYDEDYLPQYAERKTETFNAGHTLMKNCWVQGSGYVMKREFVKQLGGLKDNESYPKLCIRGALKGWQNGWYYPFIHEEHMDDPRSPYCEVKTEDDFLIHRPLTAKQDEVKNIKQWANHGKHMAYLAQKASPNPKFHSGAIFKLARLIARIKRILGIKEPWQQDLYQNP